MSETVRIATIGTGFSGILEHVRFLVNVIESRFDETTRRWTVSVEDAIRKMRSARSAATDVRADVQHGFVRRFRARLGRTVWHSGCQSRYINESGKSAVLRPGFTFRYRQSTRRFRVADYDCRTLP